MAVACFLPGRAKDLSAPLYFDIACVLQRVKIGRSGIVNFIGLPPDGVQCNVPLLTVFMLSP